MIFFLFFLNFYTTCFVLFQALPSASWHPLRMILESPPHHVRILFESISIMFRPFHDSGLSSSSSSSPSSSSFVEVLSTPLQRRRRLVAILLVGGIKPKAYTINPRVKITIGTIQTAQTNPIHNINKQGSSASQNQSKLTKKTMQRAQTNLRSNTNNQD